MGIDVHSANPHDSKSSVKVLTGLKDKFPRLKRLLGDRGYSGDLQTWFFRNNKGCLLSVIKPKAGTKGFQVQQWRSRCRTFFCMAWKR